MTLLVNLPIDCMAMIVRRLNGQHLHRLAATGNTLLRKSIACSTENVVFPASYAVGVHHIPTALFSLLTVKPLAVEFFYDGPMEAATNCKFPNNITSLRFTNAHTKSLITPLASQFSTVNLPSALSHLSIHGHTLQEPQLLLLPSTLQTLTLTVHPSEDRNHRALAHLVQLTCLCINFELWKMELFSSIPASVAALSMTLNPLFHASSTPSLEVILGATPSAIERLYIDLARNPFTPVMPPTEVANVHVRLKLRRLSLRCSASAFLPIIPFLAASASHSLSFFCVEFKKALNGSVFVPVLPYIWCKGANAVQAALREISLPAAYEWINKIGSYVAPNYHDVDFANIDWTRLNAWERDEEEELPTTSLALKETQTHHEPGLPAVKWVHFVNQRDSLITSAEFMNSGSLCSYVLLNLRNVRKLDLSIISYSEVLWAQCRFEHLSVLTLQQTNFSTLALLFDGDESSPARADCIMPNLATLTVFSYRSATEQLRMRHLPSKLTHLTFTISGIVGENVFDSETKLPQSLEILTLNYFYFSEIVPTNFLGGATNLKRLTWLMPIDLRALPSMTLFDYCISDKATVASYQIDDFQLPSSLRFISLFDELTMDSPATEPKDMDEKFQRNVDAFFDSRRPTLTHLDIGLNGYSMTKSLLCDPR